MTRIRLPRSLYIAVTLLVFSAARAAAQCPDGTPPPCGRPPIVNSRRANPALNPHAWIVVPFGNVMKAPDLEWLRDASVDLLSLDLSRWTDVSVVSDKRVGDLVRELPASRASEALTLNDGLSVARRAGAGMLVMGDFLKQGHGARIIANVFDVRSGNKVRTVTQQAAEPDSLLSAFGPLARGVLAVPPPADAKTGDVGTQNLDAYQEYLLGVKALNRYDLSEARKHLQRAMALDSTFALAHLQYSLLLSWGDASMGTGKGGEPRMHALLAQRLGAGLPKRERMLIDSRVASAGDDYAKSCEIARALVAQDSTDVQSLYLLGECSFHDSTVDPSPSDSTTGTFRNSWNTALRALTRILDLDPSYLVAFEHVEHILQANQRGGFTCPTVATPRDQCIAWHSFVLRAGDTLQTVPARDGFDSLFRAQYVRSLKERPRQINLGLAQVIAKRWFDADTTSEAARTALARTALARGDLATADAQIIRLSARATQENFPVVRTRLETAAKLGRAAEARAMFDSLVKAIPDNSSIDVPRGSMELMFGRFTRFDRGMAAVGERLGPEAVAYQRGVGRALIGQPRETLLHDEAAFFTSMKDPACTGECRLRRLQPTLLYLPHTPSGALATDSALAGKDFRFAIARFMVARDTAKLRGWARSYEQDAHDDVAMASTDFGFALISADLYLAVHDSVSALRAVRYFVDSAMTFMPVMAGGVGGLTNIMGTAFWPRAMLLRADLAAAAKQQDEARLWYGRVLDLWADADAELQPVIARIRSSLASLGPPRG